jgi:serine/threonine protein kinase
MTLEAGVVINHRYRILSTLGQGGMGAVYRAMDLNLSVEVALKENLYLTDEYTRQFKREAAILATLRHPNLPKVTDHFEIPGQGQYLVMEFITGEDLRERMDREGFLDEEEVIHIGSDICDALSYLHSRTPAVLHRDIKPGNIRITDDGHVLLVDFGLAKLQLGSQETTSGARAMTPGYSPPEQYGTSRTDPRSDIYALGATLYAALGGTAPEDSLSRITDFTRLTSIRTLNPKVSRKMASVLEKALELRAEDRYQSADDMKVALLAVVGERPLSRPITITPPPPPGSANQVRLDPPGPLKPSNKPSRPVKPARKESSLRFALIAFLSTLLLIGAIILSIVLLVRNGVVKQPTHTPAETGIFSPASTPTVANLTPTMVLPTVPYSAQIEPTITATYSAAATEEAWITAVAEMKTPEGASGEIAFASTRSGLPQIFLMNGDGSKQRQLTNLKEGACQPDWSPDGKKVVFISPCQKRDNRYPKANLFIVDRDGTNLTILDVGFGGNYDPAWSPDGNRIAFTKEVANFAQIYMIDLATMKVSALNDEKLPSRQPVWSPDGLKIAYIKTKYDTDHIWILDLNAMKDWQLTHTTNHDDSKPVWAPDGMTLYFTQSSINKYNPDMFGVPFDTDGNSKEYSLPLANHPVPSPAGDGDISSDGQWIIFEGWPDGTNHDIYKMNVSGDVVLRLTDDGKLDFQPAWRPK